MPSNYILSPESKDYKSGACEAQSNVSSSLLDIDYPSLSMLEYRAALGKIHAVRSWLGHPAPVLCLSPTP